MIFHLGPYLVDMSRLAAGGTLMDALRWEPERGSRLLIVRREDGEPSPRCRWGTATSSTASTLSRRGTA